MVLDRSSCQRVASLLNNKYVDALIKGEIGLAHHNLHASVFLMQYAFIEPDAECLAAMKGLLHSVMNDCHQESGELTLGGLNRAPDTTSSSSTTSLPPGLSSPINHVCAGPKPILIDYTSQRLSGQNLDLCSAAILYNFSLSHVSPSDILEGSSELNHKMKTSLQVAILGFEVIDKKLAEMAVDANLHRCALEMGMVILEYAIRLIENLGEHVLAKCYRHKLRIYGSSRAICLYSEYNSNAGAA